MYAEQLTHFKKAAMQLHTYQAKDSGTWQGGIKQQQHFFLSSFILFTPKSG